MSKRESISDILTDLLEILYKKDIVEDDDYNNLINRIYELKTYGRG